MDQPLGYALFPLRPFGDNDGKKGKVAENTQFRVNLMWRGDSKHWDSLRGLLAIWAHLGCLGFRGRRAFGAIRLIAPCLQLSDALKHFSVPTGARICELAEGNLQNWRDAASNLLIWYRSWRQHGQMNRTWALNDRRDRSKGGRWIPISASQQAQNRDLPGFKYARRDHNEGLDVQGTGAPNSDAEKPHGAPGTTYRPALGLPIIQFFSSLGDDKGPVSRGRATVNWEYEWDDQKRKAKGRFASPILLRPHKDAQGKWHALVIFVDAHKWDDSHKVQLVVNKQPEERRVSLDLYEAMKEPNGKLPNGQPGLLKPFP